MKQPYDGEPTDRYLVFSPTFQAKYWYFSTITTLLMPHRTGDISVTLNFHHPKGADNWKLVSSSVMDIEGKKDPRTVSFVTTFDALFGNKGSIPVGNAGTAINFVFGETDHRTAEMPNGPYKIDMNLYGKPDFVESTDKLFDLLSRNIRLQRSFWPSIDQDHFLITFTTYNNKGTDRFGGFRWTNGFSSFIPQRPLSVPKEPALSFATNLAAFYTHEFSHNWLDPKFVREDQLEELGWFLEGGADFCAEWFVYRTDDNVDLDGYALRYNRLLAEYYRPGEGPAEGRVLGMDDLLKVFWDADYYQRQPYLRGFLLLHNWHARIRKHTRGKKGGHDLLREFVVEGKKAPLTLEKAREIAKRYWPEGIDEDIRQYWIDGGKEIRPDPDVFGPGYRVVTVDGLPRVEPDPETREEKAGSGWFNE